MNILRGVILMKKKVNLLNRVFSFVFGVASIILLLSLIRKSALFLAFIWEFTKYHEHYAAYLIFSLVYLICHITGQILKRNRRSYNLR